MAFDNGTLSVGDGASGGGSVFGGLIGASTVGEGPRVVEASEVSFGTIGTSLCELECSRERDTEPHLIFKEMCRIKHVS